MELSLSSQEIIFIYGHFRKQVRQLEEIKSAPNCPLSNSDIDKEIKFYSSIADKFRDICPNLAELDKYKI